MECIESISQQHYEWVNSIVASKLLYNGQSLHRHEPPVPTFFTDGLTTASFKDYVYLTVLPTNPTSFASKDFLCRANAIHNDNMDCWFTNNSNVYHAIAVPYLSSNKSAPPPGPGANTLPATTPTIVYESLKDKSAKVNITWA
jgi:hypothetical protein